MSRRRTRRLMAIAAALLRHPDTQHYAYELSKQAGVRTGTIYPILWRWLADGWLADGWDPPLAEGRPGRRWYTVTRLGERELRRILPAPEMHRDGGHQ